MIKVLGRIVSYVGSVTVKGDNYDEYKISVLRGSGVVDNLLLLTNKRVEINAYYRVEGDVRTYKDTGAYKTRTKIFTYSLEEVYFDGLSDEEKCLNVVEDEVIVTKAGEMRRTPNKYRILDLKFGKNIDDKFYTYNGVAWGSNAKNFSNLSEGTVVRIVGRLQERTYRKKVNDKVVERNTHEVSISRIEIVN